MGFLSNAIARLTKPKSTGFSNFSADYMMIKVLRQKLGEMLKPYLTLKELKKEDGGRLTIIGVPKGERSDIALSARLDIAEDGSRVTFSEITSSREWVQAFLKQIAEQRTLDVPERLTGAALSIRSFLLS
ncbi:MAG: hypothetical protein J5828_01335 [Desulfovibrionaceae bacterium]|nr:hypothetical protein [Desulfovibrionaceae bacterium]